MELSNYLIFPTQPQGAQNVPNRSVTLGTVTTNGEGAGMVDVFVPGQEQRVRSAFEQPIEIRNENGDLVRTLKPFSREAMEFLSNGGLHAQGFAIEKQ